jgi:integrase
MAIHKLTALRVDKLRKPGMHGDGGGLWLRIDGGSKTWVFRFMLAGQARSMGLGPYPDIGLVEARAKALEARTMRRAGADPIEARRAVQASQRLEAAKSITFKDAAEKYIASHRAGWKHPKHEDQWKRSLAIYAYPVIGSLPVAAIDTGLVMKVIEPHWATKTESVSRVRGRIELVLDWARVRGYRAGENPAQWRGHLAQLLPAKAKVAKAGHHAAMPYRDLPAFMERLWLERGSAARALELVILTAVRVNEALGATAGELDLAAGLWTIPGTRMKGGREHRVPLPARAADILQDIGPDMFAGETNETVRQVLRRMGLGKLTIHGFRSTFKDWAAECTNTPDWVSEKALAHLVGDETRRSYQRGDLLEKRRKLMEAWAQYCSTPPASNIVQLRAQER